MLSAAIANMTTMMTKPVGNIYFTITQAHKFCLLKRILPYIMEVYGKNGSIYECFLRTSLIGKLRYVLKRNSCHSDTKAD